MASSAVSSSQEFAGKVRTEFLYQDDQCVVFEADEDRQASVHFRVVPRRVVTRLVDGSMDDEKLLGHLLLVANTLAVQKGLNRTGYHVMAEEDHRTQTLNSLHVFERALHHMLWPIGPGSRL